MWPRSSKQGGAPVAVVAVAAVVREEEEAAAAEEGQAGEAAAAEEEQAGEAEAVPREGVAAGEEVTYLEPEVVTCLGAPAAEGVQRGPTDAAPPASRMGMAASSAFPVPPPRSPPWSFFGCSERAFASMISLDESNTEFIVI